MKVVVTGSRVFPFSGFVYSGLELMNSWMKISGLAQGCAPGVDTIAKDWCMVNGVPCTDFIADWSEGPKGGLSRNKKMVDEFKPDVVLAFPGNRGTVHCANYAHKKGNILVLGVAPLTETYGGNTGMRLYKWGSRYHADVKDHDAWARMASHLTRFYDQNSKEYKERVNTERQRDRLLDELGMKRGGRK